MKKYLSVFGFMARSSVYKILGLFVLMLGAESLFFILRFPKDDISKYYFANFEECVVSGFIPLIFAVAFTLVTVLICFTGMEYRSKSGYTLRRLAIKESSVFWIQAIYNGIVYLLFWAVQIAIVYLLSFYYLSTAPEKFVSNQSVFLSFYRNSFMHSLLPLEDILLWIRNFLLIIALSVSAAELTYKQRRKKYGVMLILNAVVSVAFFKCEAGDLGCLIMGIIAVGISVLSSIFTLKNTEDSYDN